MCPIARRNVIRDAAGPGGVVAIGGLADCGKTVAPVEPDSGTVVTAEAARRRIGGSLARASVSPAVDHRPVWRDCRHLAYGDAELGPSKRATAGDTLRVDVACWSARSCWGSITIRRRTAGSQSAVLTPAQCRPWVAPMAPCRWTVNGKTFPTPRSVEPGRAGSGSASKRRRVFQPMQLHGHTFAVVDGGARKDTGMVRPMQSPDVALDADHPQWVAHCHIHHAESGMMTTPPTGQVD